jgi:hypothetical protein
MPRKKANPPPPSDVPQRDDPSDYKISESPAYTLNLLIYRLNGSDQLQGAALLLTLILLAVFVASFFFDTVNPAIKDARPYLGSLLTLTIGVAIGRGPPEKKD